MLAGARSSRRCATAGLTIASSAWARVAGPVAAHPPPHARAPLTRDPSQADKEVVEQILTQAKKDGKTNEVVGAKDKLDGKTPVDLARERQAELLAAAAASGGGEGEEKGELEEKRKYDLILQMLEKGVQQ